MKIISFHLRGKMAHFRKFYSNSSALSYFVPPRTTICGIVAGLLGLGRDKYYEVFSINHFHVAMNSEKPLKKTIQTLNYLMIKSPRDLNGSQEHHSQTPTELIIPQDINLNFIDYKIFISHENQDITEQLINIFSNEGEFYKSMGACMSLGSAFNLGWIDSMEILEGETIEKKSENLISSAIPLDKIKRINLESKGLDYKIIKEELPLEFNNNRQITSRGLKDIIINISGRGIYGEVDSFIKLENGQNILWLG
ncbi:MAG: CRISPR-associated protein Cas5 [Eubacteriaceae bacterium]